MFDLGTDTEGLQRLLGIHAEDEAGSHPHAADGKYLEFTIYCHAAPA
jgi:hypothetical protein